MLTRLYVLRIMISFVSSCSGHDKENINSRFSLSLSLSLSLGFIGGEAPESAPVNHISKNANINRI